MIDGHNLGAALSKAPGQIVRFNDRGHDRKASIGSSRDSRHMGRPVLKTAMTKPARRVCIVMEPSSLAVIPGTH